MKKLLLLSAVALLFGLSTDALAQGHHGSHNRQRIRRGVRSGQLTREEARTLRERQRQIRAERRGYRSDGLTREERREIRRDRREQSRAIRDYRRNDDVRRYGILDRYERRRGNGYYRRGAGSPTHPVFGRRGSGRRGRY